MSTPSPRPPRPNDRRGFEIAVICALPLEADAIGALFDYYWDDDGSPFDKEPGDPNAYSTGVIGRHNVVLAHMPGMGKANAAAVATKCHMSFPNIRLALVVGVCGVVPFMRNGDEIVLGDVVISDGIVQYDLGRRLPDQFVTKDTLLDALGRPNPEIRGVLAKLKTYRGQEDLTSKTIKCLDVMRCNPRLHATYPGSANDRLFEAAYRHSEDQKSCDQAGCNGKLVSRHRLEMSGTHLTPAIHFGLMASGDSVMKSGEDRDKIAEAGDCIAFEMEGAGVWDNFPCIVIKGACDYADSHKSKVWQRYAAATAAACTKAFLSFWVPSFTQDTQGRATNFEKRVSLQNQEYSGQSKAEPQEQSVFLVPFSKNDLFVGREDVLTRLRSLLFGQGRQKVALVGLGGLGKTQIALQLAFWVKENKQDYSVFWMPALSMAGFEQECMKLVKTLGIRCSEGEDAKDAVRQHLSSKDAGSWFLVVDNADDAEIFHKSTHPGGGILNFLPSSDNGRTLFTTRSRQVAIAAAKTAIEKLPQMHPEEATVLLKRSLIDKDGLDDSESVSQLLDALTCLPLAIAQAAAYMNVYETPIVEYIRVFKDADAENTIELLKEGYDDEVHYDSSQGAVATTWIVSFDRVHRTAPAAADLLSFMACIEPRGIPRSILPKLKTEQQMTQAIGTLTGHGFLSRREGEEAFDMHSLVHLATRIWNKNEDREREVLQTTLTRVAEVFPTDDWKNRDMWRQYLPHALRLLRTAGCIENKRGRKLGLLVGQCLLVDGRTTEAVSTLEHVVKIRERISAEDHPSRLTSEHELARAYLDDGHTKKAVEMLEHVVEIRERILAEDHPHRLASEHVLAQAYLDDGQTRRAVEMLEHVVEIRERISAEDHPHRLASEHELAGAYLDDGQTKKAVEMLEHVVAVEAEILTEDHLDRLASEHVLAQAYLDDGQSKKAVEVLEHVAETQERILAEDHPRRLASEHELARAYLADGQTKKAVKMLEHVVEIRERVLAEDHQDRLASEHELARAYLTDGQTKKAVEMLEHVVETQERVLAEDHQDRLTSEHELARAYLTDGQTKKAVEMLEHVVEIRERILAEDHLDRLISENVLAGAYLDDGQTKKAIEMLEHVVAVEAEILAEDDPSRHLSQDLLQYCYERLEGAGAVMESKASVLGEEM
ncbi:Nephrocystin-3 [Fusarium oxysporum f. sp. rapae]|uniref:Nephrocystin-3 n=1 Tax=Fusarium oxysporum f. sp. rapae TaxID=485398 RepID=A0A8J5TRB0_FUSOX|nr:Nephrocystin-3 [Fusarium oxysporum f. sp. rapae]